MGFASTFSAKITLKLGLMALFTHLKIILLQCFQFSVFSNKRYSNRLLEISSKFTKLPKVTLCNVVSLLIGIKSSN